MRIFLLAVFVLHLPVYASEFDCSNFTVNLIAGVPVEAERIEICVSQLSDEQLGDVLETLVIAKRDVVAASLIRAIARERPNPPIMHLAVSLDQIAVVSSLLKRDESLLNRKDDSGYAPIVTAGLAGAERVAAILIDEGATADLGEALVIASGHSAAVAKIIIEHHGRLLTSPRIASRVVSAGAGYQNSEFVQYLLHHGADPNLTDKFGNSVAFAALHNRNQISASAIWSLLIEAGANVKKDICAFDDEKLVQMHANSPDWFIREVTTIRLDCDAN
jgi:hypothetical protein